jgi:hypothetical protein
MGIGLTAKGAFSALIGASYAKTAYISSHPFNCKNYLIKV